MLGKEIYPTPVTPWALTNQFALATVVKTRQTLIFLPSPDARVKKTPINPIPV